MNTNLSSKQAQKVSEWYNVDATEVSGYARFESGKLIDFIIHFSGGSMAWLDASRSRGLYLSKVK